MEHATSIIKILESINFELIYPTFSNFQVTSSFLYLQIHRITFGSFENSGAFFAGKIQEPQLSVLRIGQELNLISHVMSQMVSMLSDSSAMRLN